jgi:hypothetical protein
MCWEFKGKPLFLDAAPSAGERKSRIAGVITAGELEARRKRNRLAMRRMRARDHAAYLAGCVEDKVKPRPARKQSIAAKILQAAGFDPSTGELVGRRDRPAKRRRERISRQRKLLEPARERSLVAIAERHSV